MKIVNIVGARPQFIKIANVSRAIAERNANSGDRLQEVVVHTGQHFDENMSKVFFEQLGIPRPHHHLGIAGLQHGAMTGRMLEAIEDVLLNEQPAWVVVYGDTNSTLAGALAAIKLQIPVAHVEAGLRSFNRRMPEEINRVVADHVSTLLLCPTVEAVRNLEREGIRASVRNVGDVMYDAALRYREVAMRSYSLEAWDVEDRRYALCTVHRAENTEDPGRFRGIWSALSEIACTMPVILPVHPRTAKLFPDELRSARLRGIRVIEPLSYLEMTRLECSARAILTDSGGVQKEAFFHRVPCLTLRDETEWVETVQLGWNMLCGTHAARIVDAWNSLATRSPTIGVEPYGDGTAARKIVDELVAYAA